MIFSKYNFTDKNSINVLEINIIRFMLKTGKIKIYNKYDKYHFAMICYNDMRYSKGRFFRGSNNFFRGYSNFLWSDYCLAPLIKNNDIDDYFCQYCSQYQKEVCLKLRHLDIREQDNIIKNYIPEEIL